MTDRKDLRGVWPMVSETGPIHHTSDLIARRLRKLHERVALVTERGTPTAYAELAVHYDRGGNCDKAYEYALLAADAARDGHHLHEALDFLRLAERNTTSPAQLAEVRVRIAHASDVLGRPADAVEQYDLAIEFHLGQGNRRRALTLRRIREQLRVRLGQPFRVVLGACMVLDEEARDLGLLGERAALAATIAHLHTRLGERQTAERTAETAVQLAEQHGDPGILADALNRLAVIIGNDRTSAALELYRRAIELYQRAGDRRGEAWAHNNLAVDCQRKNNWELAEQAFVAAIDIARASSALEVRGAATMNLGVGCLRRGQYERAQELFGEAFAVFAALGQREYELIALYNLAHLDRERGDFQSAAELYDVAASIAQRLGQSDLDIGAHAGAGLALLAQGKFDAARAALQATEERMRARKEWFQGRELVDALRVRLALADGRRDDAVRLFEEALPGAEQYNLYNAAWLTDACAATLFEGDPKRLRVSVDRFAARVKDLGYTHMSTRYAELLSRA